MSDQQITCPNCNHTFALGDVLTESIRGQLRAELEGDILRKQEETAKRLADAKAREKALAEREEKLDDQVEERLEAERQKVVERERKRAAQEAAAETKALQEQLAEQQAKLNTANAKEAEFLKREAALEEQKAGLDLELQRKLSEERERLTADARKQAEEAFEYKRKAIAEETERLQAQVAERDQRLEEAKAKEQALQQQQAALQERERGMEQEVARRLAEEAEKLTAKERAKAEEAQQAKVRELDETIRALQDQKKDDALKLQEARDKELEFLKKEGALQAREQELELELQRKLLEERKTIAEDARKRAEEDNVLKLRQKDDQLKALQEQMTNLQRRLEQGSQESQGEALEGYLQDTLAAQFPFDSFEEVKKGARGADVVQIVRDRQGRECGRILWEAKNAKSFSKEWIHKLQEDQRENGAELAVLMTVAFPQGMERFGTYEETGIWIVDPPAGIGLCAALREQLILVARVKQTEQHRDGVKDVLFDYVTGPEFRGRVAILVEAYVQMQQDLDSEKRSFQRQWKKREKQIGRVLTNVSAMYGELQGMVGSQAALPDVDALSIDSLGADDDDDTDD